MRIYYLIDRIPELPYFMLALFYMSYTPPERFMHVFAIAFFYLITSISLGITVKALLRTERPCDYHCIPAVRYDIPSLHTMISAGAVVVIYFIEPLYCLIMAPLGVLYMYSRLKLGLHSKNAVYAGAALGVLTGLFYGLMADKISFGGLESVYAVSFFILPICATIFRLRYLENPKVSD
jgi:membrane-associated phospholipid phosphatase